MIYKFLGFLENNAPIHSILTSDYGGLGLHIIRTYPHFIKESSIDFRFYILVRCLKHHLDINIIHSLFYSGIIDSNVLEHVHRNQSGVKPINRCSIGKRNQDTLDGSMPLYFMYAIHRQYLTNENRCYFREIFNLFIDCFEGRKIPESRNPNSGNSFHRSENHQFQQFLEGALNFHYYSFKDFAKEMEELKLPKDQEIQTKIYQEGDEW